MEWACWWTTWPARFFRRAIRWSESLCWTILCPRWEWENISTFALFIAKNSIISWFVTWRRLWIDASRAKLSHGETPIWFVFWRYCVLWYMFFDFKFQTQLIRCSAELHSNQAEFRSDQLGLIKDPLGILAKKSPKLVNNAYVSEDFNPNRSSFFRISDLWIPKEVRIFVKKRITFGVYYILNN